MTTEIMPVSRITDGKTALRFMFAGNSYFTLRSMKTSARYTFNVNVCGRKLTVPESIEAGLGPECAGLVEEEF